jgi:hypothetical protein
MTDQPPCLTSAGCWRKGLGICTAALRFRIRAEGSGIGALRAECERLREEAADPGTTPDGWRGVAP